MQNCYKPEKVPQEVRDSQNDRLTTQHIQTLTFMQDVAGENTRLKERVVELEAQLESEGDIEQIAAENQERIKMIQEKYMARADDINKLMADKHQQELLQQVNEHVEAERKWYLEREQLIQQMELIQKMNKNFEEQLALRKGSDNQSKILVLKVEALQEEIERLKKNLEAEKKTTGMQVKEIQRLQGVVERQRTATTELAELKQKVQELELKVKQQERELEDAASTAGGDADLVDVLKMKLAKAVKQKTQIAELHAQCPIKIKQLEDQVSKLQRLIASKDKEMDTMRGEISTLVAEIRKLRGRSPKENVNFKDFVSLKRELGVVKEENHELKTGGPTRPLGKLPALKYETPSSLQQDSGLGDRLLVRGRDKTTTKPLARKPSLPKSRR